MEAYSAGQRVFGESRPQELAAKAAVLPEDISWHFIGHLQTNKLKLVLPVAAMVESVDSLHLLEAIDRWGRENGKVIQVLLEFHIASEDTKQGFSREEILDIVSKAGNYGNVCISGLIIPHSAPPLKIFPCFSRRGQYTGVNGAGKAQRRLLYETI